MVMRCFSNYIEKEKSMHNFSVMLKFLASNSYPCWIGPCESIQFDIWIPLQIKI